MMYLSIKEATRYHTVRDRILQEVRDSSDWPSYNVAMAKLELWDCIHDIYWLSGVTATTTELNTI